MNNQEAKFILRAYRPDGRDAQDPLFGPALEQARLDAELARWLQGEQALDRTIAERVGSVEVPPGLRAAILTGARVSGGGQVARFPRWRWVALSLAAAAAVAVVASIGLLRPAAVDQSTLIAQLRADAMDHSLHGDLDDAGMRSVHALLAATSTRLTRDFRPELGELRAKGCRTLTVGGRELFEVCFVRVVQGGAPVEFHLYVGRKRDFPVQATTDMPLFAEQGGLASAAWADGERAYFVATEAGIEAVRAIL